MFVPGERSEGCHIAGAGRGLWGIGRALDDGPAAGAAAAEAVGYAAEAPGFRVGAEHEERGATHTELPTDGSPGKAKAFVDYQNDVTAKDIRLTVCEGFRSIEHVKRYTTNGMATDQGKLSNMNGLMIAADAVGKRPLRSG